MENKKINTFSCLFNIDLRQCIALGIIGTCMKRAESSAYVLSVHCVCVCVKLKQQGERVCLRTSSDYRSECNPNPSLDYFDF